MTEIQRRIFRDSQQWCPVIALDLFPSPQSPDSPKLNLNLLFPFPAFSSLLPTGSLVRKSERKNAEATSGEINCGFIFPV